MKDGLSEEEVEEGSDVSMDDQKEVFSSGDVEERMAADGLRWVRPETGAYEVGVAGTGGHDNKDDEESETVGVNAGSQRVKERGKRRGEGKGPVDVSVREHG